MSEPTQQESTEHDAAPREQNAAPRSNPRADLLIAIAIAAASLTTAVAAWRTSDLGSRAGDADRRGLIQGVQAQSYANEDWRLVYEEAASAQRYFVSLAEAEALQSHGDPASLAQADAIRRYLLPSLALLAGPTAADDRYLKADRSLDLQQRFDDVQALNTDLEAIDPQGAFAEADRLHAEQRWLVVGTVLIAISLFWLALAEINRDRGPSMALTLGLTTYGVGLAWFVTVELLSFLAGR